MSRVQPFQSFQPVGEITPMNLQFGIECLVMLLGAFLSADDFAAWIVVARITTKYRKLAFLGACSIREWARWEKRNVHHATIDNLSVAEKKKRCLHVNELVIAGACCICRKKRRFKFGVLDEIPRHGIVAKKWILSAERCLEDTDKHEHIPFSSFNRRKIIIFDKRVHTPLPEIVVEDPCWSYKWQEPMQKKPMQGKRKRVTRDEKWERQHATLIIERKQKDTGCWKHRSNCRVF
jgi:hypothetical protein